MAGIVWMLNTKNMNTGGKQGHRAVPEEIFKRRGCPKNKTSKNKKKKISKLG